MLISTWDCSGDFRELPATKIFLIEPCKIFIITVKLWISSLSEKNNEQFHENPKKRHRFPAFSELLVCIFVRKIGKSNEEIFIGSQEPSFSSIFTESLVGKIGFFKINRAPSPYFRYCHCAKVHEKWLSLTRINPKTGDFRWFLDPKISFKWSFQFLFNNSQVSNYFSTLIPCNLHKNIK